MASGSARNGPPINRCGSPPRVAAVGHPHYHDTSRRIDFAGLSVLIPRNVGWRIWPSGVHSVKLTSATVEGFTHRSLPAARLLHRPFVGANSGSKVGRSISSF